MARNIEIKARVDNIEAIAVVAASLANTVPVEIYQDDTFFQCKTGRLKLRAFSENQGELIFYNRPDHAGPKECFYVRSQTTEPTSLREALSLAYSQAGRVRKKRMLYLIGKTRIHLDRVEGLGDFLELEVVLSEGESPQHGIDIAHQLMEKLGVDPSQLIEGAYVDLLNKTASNPSPVNRRLSQRTTVFYGPA
jgi:predicted adenylyl cyclase CyaB